MKTLREWLEESSQMGGPKGKKRTKQEELEIADQSPIYKKTQYQGWKINPTVHAAAQAYDRRPGFEFSDWKELHRRAIRAMKDENVGSGEYIVFSKSMNQGYVFAADTRRKTMRIITVLPRGKKRPLDGTEVLMVEQIIQNAEFLEVE